MWIIVMVCPTKSGNLWCTSIGTSGTQTFAKLSEMYFRGTTWPPVQYISGLVDDDSVFCLLYKV